MGVVVAFPRVLWSYRLCFLVPLRIVIRRTPVRQKVFMLRRTNLYVRTKVQYVPFIVHHQSSQQQDLLSDFTKFIRNKASCALICGVF